MLYDQMLMLYPQEIILIAARECRHSGKDTEETLKLLQSWKEKGLSSKKDVETYVQAFHDQTALIRNIKKICGTDDNRIGKQDRSLVSKWTNELGFGPETILAAASYASEAKAPMAYLDKILAGCHEKGITTSEQIRREHEQSKTADNASGKRKTMTAQNYEQRNYQEVQDQMMEAQKRRILERLQADGGKSDA